MEVVAGLGNPGPRYEGTRHNAGFLVVDELARRHGGRFRREGRGDAAREEARVALPRVEGAAVELLLVKPQSYMNVSGTPVQAVLARARLSPAHLLVVHDDVDLPLGRLRFRRGGGSGGQRGVNDVIAKLGPAFLRLKVGVSRPPPGWATDAWVLSRFRPEELPLLHRVVAAAADAVETLYREGLQAAMNRTNGLDLAAEAPAD